MSTERMSAPEALGNKYVRTLNYEWVDGLGWRFDFPNKHLYFEKIDNAYFADDWVTKDYIMAWLEEGEEKVISGATQRIIDGLQIEGRTNEKGATEYPVLAFVPIEHEYKWQKFYSRLNSRLSANFISTTLSINNHHYVQNYAASNGWRPQKKKYNKAVLDHLRNHLSSFKQPEDWLTRSQLADITGVERRRASDILDILGYESELRISGTAVRKHYPPEAIECLRHIANSTLPAPNEWWTAQKIDYIRKHAPPRAGDWYTARRISQEIAAVSIHGLGWTKDNLQAFMDVSELRLDDGGKSEIHYPPRVLGELIKLAMEDANDYAPDDWLSTREVASMFDIHVSAANNMMHRFGVEQKPKLNKNGLTSRAVGCNPEQVLEIFNNHNLKESIPISDLAEQMGVTKEEMRKMLDRHHIAPNAQGNGAIFRKGQRLYQQNSAELIRKLEKLETTPTPSPDRLLLETIRANSGINFEYVDEQLGYRFDMAGKHMYIKNVSDRILQDQWLNLQEFSKRHKIPLKQVELLVSELQIPSKINERNQTLYPTIAAAPLKSEYRWRKYYDSLDETVSSSQVANMLHKYKQTILRLGKKLDIPSVNSFYSKNDVNAFRDYYQSFKYAEGWVTDNYIAQKINKDHRWVGQKLSEARFDTDTRMCEPGNRALRCYPPSAEQFLRDLIEGQSKPGENEYNYAQICKEIEQKTVFGTRWVEKRLESFSALANEKLDSRNQSRLYYPQEVVDALLEMAQNQKIV